MSFTLRELVEIVFRQKRLIGIVFACSLVLFAFVVFIQPNVYDAEMKIFVKQTRVDPMVTPDPQWPRMIGNLTEQDLSSEAELLKSKDLLEHAAIECHLEKPATNYWAFVPVVNAFAAPPARSGAHDVLALSQAVRDLDQSVQAIPVKNSNMISVTYPSTNPALAACILNTIAKLYMEKHLAVHRPNGTFEFFKQEADRYKTDLAGIETQLAQFGQQQQMVTEGTEKDIAVRKLGDYTASLLDTKTAISETKARIQSLQTLAHSTQQRQTRAVRTAPNEALKDLQTQLVTLQMKRTEMLGKFAPSYRPLQDLEKQIQELKTTMADVQKSPLVEETTDTNPANDWLEVELAKARSELASLQASAPAKERAVSEYRTKTLDLDQKDIRRADLIRMAKATEENYLLYLRKQEEARIDQELDRQRILNVAIAQDATIPVLPEPSLISVKLIFLTLLASLMSLGVGIAVDHYDRTFRTPAEVAACLDILVLGSIPLIGLDNNTPSKGLLL